MSIEDLQADLTANMEEVKNLSALSTIGDVVNHLKNTLWPFVENVVREQGEMDASLRDMYEQSEDILQFETGKQLAAVIGGAMTLVADLEQRATAAGDAQTLKAIGEWRGAAQEAAALLEDITLPEGYEDEGDEGEDVDDDSEDDDDDDEKGGVQ